MGGLYSRAGRIASQGNLKGKRKKLEKKIPNPKHQIPNKLQIPITKRPKPREA
jgi:hypothetical protein